MKFVIECLICDLIWFSILAISGVVSWLKDRPRRKARSRKTSNEILIALFSLLGTLVGSGGGILV